MKQLILIIVTISLLSCGKDFDIQSNEIKTPKLNLPQTKSNSHTPSSILDSLEISPQSFDSLNSNEKFLYLVSLYAIASEIGINPGFQTQCLYQVDVNYNLSSQYNYMFEDDFSNPDSSNSNFPAIDIAPYSVSEFYIRSGSSVPNYNLNAPFSFATSFNTPSQLIEVIKEVYLSFINRNDYTLGIHHLILTKHEDYFGNFSHYSLWTGDGMYYEEPDQAYDEEREMQLQLAREAKEAAEFQKYMNMRKGCSAKFEAYARYTGLPMSIVKITPCHLINRMPN